MGTTELNLLTVDLTDHDQKYLIDTLLLQDLDINIWSWNSSIGHDPAWLLAQLDLVDQVIMRASDHNPLVSMLASRGNSFYIKSDRVNILDSVAVNPVNNIEEVPLHV